VGTRAPDFDILGETPDLIAVNKPAGLLAHPTKPNGPPTLWDGLRALLCYELANDGRISLINRLDRETSGTMLVAKSAPAARRAGIAMHNKMIAKSYLAIVAGWPQDDSFEVTAPIIRLGEVAPSPVHLLRAVHPAGDAASTRFRVVRKFLRGGKPFALVAAEPLTGRTHKIRVHLAHAGTPVVGDKLYGHSPDCYLEFIRTGWTPSLERLLLLPRHALHSSRIALDWHGRTLEWSCGLPPDMRCFLNRDTSPQEPASDSANGQEHERHRG
jgi:23S rRNA pseudouridine1911/1915/1917 synthase